MSKCQTLWNSLSVMVLYIRWHFLEGKSVIGKIAQEIKVLTMQTFWPAIYPWSHIKEEDKSQQDGSVSEGPCH